MFLAEAEGAEFAAGPFKLADVTVVLVFLPALVSLLYFEFVSLLFGTSRYIGLRDALVERLYPSLLSNDLQRMLGPTTITIFRPDPWRHLRARERGFMFGLLRVLAAIVSCAIGFGALAFLVYAYVRLLGLRDADHTMVLVSAPFAGFNALRAVLTYVDELYAAV